MIDRKTPALQLPLPDPANTLADDVQRLIASYNLLDSIVNGKASGATLSSHIGNASNPHGTTAAQVGAIPDAAGACTDTRIGSRTVDQTQAPPTGNSGNFTQFLSWFANRIKAITGTPNWFDAPGTTLASAATHIASSANPHGTTAAQVGAIPTGPGTVTDTYIGSRLLDDTASPTGNEATLLTLLSWLANQIKAAKGTATWRTSTPTTLTAAAGHIASSSNPHGTTAAQVGAPTTSGTGATGTWPISVTGSAGSVPWTGVSGRPTALSGLTNDLSIIRAYQFIAGATQSAGAFQHYVMMSASVSTLTLPLTPNQGDVVGVTFLNSQITNVIGRNGGRIMGLAEDMTIDFPYWTVILRYIDTTNGWWVIS